MSSPTPILRFRDQFKKYIPWWLSDRHLSSGQSVGYRFLWVLIAALDGYTQAMLEALRAAWPGYGTPTALPYIGQSRGLIRARNDTNATYATRLIAWLDKWAHAGSARQLATELHEYLGNSARIRVITRSGYWVTCNTDGTFTTTNATWNWDGTSNPERSGYWWDLWVIIYPTPYALRGGTLGGLTGDDGFSLGHLVPHAELDALKSILANWISAHSHVRAVVWTSDSTLFDPTTPASLPDGTWGRWSTPTNGTSTFSGRNRTTCRYWEPIA